MRKRTLVSALLVAGLGFALAGCGSQNGDAASADNPATASGTLRIMIPSFPVSNDGKAAFQKVVDDFHKKWPKIAVEPDFVTYANMNEKVSTSIASGAGYDVLVTGVGWIQPLAAKNVFKPLSDVGVTKQSVTDQSIGALVPALTYKGKLYGYPITADTRAVALRKSAFVEAGLDPSKPPRTMAELKQDAEKLTKRDANGTITRSGFDFRAAPGGYRQDFVWLLASTGTTLYTADGKPNFANAKGEQTLDWMKSMVNNVEAYGKQNAAQTPLVYTGEAAMGFTTGAVDCGTTGIGQANCDDLEYFLLDNGKPSMFVGGNLASIGSTTKNPQAAWDFIKALTSPDAAQDQARLNTQIPASKDAAKSPIVRSNPLSQFVSSHLSDAIYEGGAQNWLEVRNQFNTGIDQALLGKRSAKDVLQELAAQSK